MSGYQQCVGDGLESEIFGSQRKTSTLKWSIASSQIMEMIAMITPHQRVATSVDDAYDFATTCEILLIIGSLVPAVLQPIFVSLCVPTYFSRILTPNYIVRV